jgi:hypothetical protein
MRAAYPFWLFALVALLIAGTAFGIAQIAPGMGAPFVALASTLWVAFVAARQRNWQKKNV